ncbi:type VII secretion protein EccE [Nocardia brasiliensis]|uniref:type VII secretion protein EccE n=1 Tax=Nocardia brasiliensis TaxID=37326 RepID=UPI002453F4EC|nr:type VII secretion protein EccE [Nocardia brasiliensis]
MRLPRIEAGVVEQGPVATIVLGGSLLVSGLWARTPWWVLAVVVGGLLTLVAVRVNSRSGVRWLLDWIDYRFGRTARARARIDAEEVDDIEVAAGTCGIKTADTVLVAMIQLAPNLDLPTVIAERSVYTEDTIPIAALLPMLEHYGIAVDIDIVTTGQRIRPTGSYSMLYDQLIGAHPVVGHRLTWLVVRLDLERNLAALRRRGPVEVMAPKALATAAHRIAGRLRERGISAHALPAVALREASRTLHLGVELPDLREKWSCLESSTPGRFVTSFQVDWSRLGGAGLDDCWAWHRGWTTLVVSLTGAATELRAIARYVGPQVTTSPPDYLRLLTGRQSAALSATLPSGSTAHRLPSHGSRAEIPWSELRADLTVAIGPNGQILGSISGQPRHTLALPLFDPARYNPRRRTVDVHAVLPVAQQLILRAMVVGADVEVHSTRPQRWSQLVAAVGDPNSLRMAQDMRGSESGSSSTTDPQPAPATIAVFDNLPPYPSSAQTTVTISDPGGPRQRSVDLAIDQVDPNTVDVSIPMRTVRVDLIEPWGETRYFGGAEPHSASVATNGAVVPHAGSPSAGHRVS